LTASVQALDYLRHISVPKLKLNHKLEDLHMEEQGRTTPARFALGHIVATPGALGALEEAAQTPGEFLARHALGDWGELDENDRQENEFSLARGFRLLSAYNLSNGTRIWVITEADCSATTLLLPSEY
jgi:hypothetical protein